MLKNLPAMQETWGPQTGKIPWRRKWQLTPVFYLENTHGPRSLAGYSPGGCKELDMTEYLSTAQQYMSFSMSSTLRLKFSAVLISVKYLEATGDRLRQNSFIMNSVGHSHFYGGNKITEIICIQHSIIQRVLLLALFSHKVHSNDSGKVSHSPL